MTLHRCPSNSGERFGILESFIVRHDAGSATTALPGRRQRVGYDDGDGRGPRKAAHGGG